MVYLILESKNVNKNYLITNHLWFAGKPNKENKMKKLTFIALFLFITCTDSIIATKQDCHDEILGGHCYGCTDPNACNWDPSASRFNNTCTYIPLGTCDCDGNIYDCAGICGGSSILDECNICGGDGSGC